MKAGSLQGSGHPGGRWRVAAWAGAAAAVVVPVLALQAIQPFEWEPGHAVMILLVTAIAGLAYETAVRLPPRMTLRGGLLLTLAGIVLTVWFNGAVGIIGVEENPANRMFLVPITIALAGSAIAFFRPAAAAGVLVAAAFAQFGTFFYALAAGHGFIGPVTVLFCALWLASSALYGRAARQRANAAPQGASGPASTSTQR